MPSRADLVHRTKKRAAIAYLVSAISTQIWGLDRLICIRSECDATIQRDRGSAA